MASRLVTPAEDPAVTLTEAKAGLRVDTSDDDTLISELLMSSQKFLEDRAGISIMYQEWETLFDGFPAGELSLIRPPLFWDGGVPKLLNVNYFDVDGEEQLLAAANYQVRDYVRKIALVPAVGLDWP